MKTQDIQKMQKIQTTQAKNSNKKLPSIAITGASGRMGQMLIAAIEASSDLQIGAQFRRDGSTAVQAALEEVDCLIDFSAPQSTLAFLPLCLAANVGMVIGTTGFTAPQKASIENAARKIPIVFSPNMSVGVNVSLKLLETAARYLSPQQYDIEILEAHHRHKVDAPSGTAIKMGEVIATAQNSKLEDRASYARQGLVGARKAGTIGFAALRGGDIVGDHTVLFASMGERIEISHKSSSREAYAQGSLAAVRFLQDKKSGLFDMFDVLGLR